jgi:hypothetical protein
MQVRSPGRNRTHGALFACKKASRRSAMNNPWIKKNPFMSMWLSGANAAIGSARGRATAEIQAPDQRHGD